MGHRTDKTRTEDLTTDQRAHRHPTKANDYTEEAQNVRNDDIGQLDQMDSQQQIDHSRNKATESKDDE